MKSGRPIGTVFAAIAIAVTYGTGVARGETTGDIYVASADGILEVATSSGSVLDRVSDSTRLGPIAIRPDGRELFAKSGERDILRIDLESMAVTSRVALPASGGALAHPRGEQLVAALPSLRRLAILDTGTGRLSRSEPLPGAVDLLAADRRDGRVVAAARGERWVGVFDPGTGSVRSTTIIGTVAAVAFDGSQGIVIVATTAPDRVVGLDLRDFATVWSAPLVAAPSAVAATTDKTLVAAGRTLWAMDRVASSGGSFLDAPSTQPSARRWASLAKPATTLTMNDDGTFVFALEVDQVEGFSLQRPVGTESAAPGATRTVRLTGARAPLAIVAVPAAMPLRGGPGSGPRSDTPGAGVAALTPEGGPPAKPPSTDTVPDDAARWIGIPQVVPEAFLVGMAILVLGLAAIRLYERSGEV